MQTYKLEVSDTIAEKIVWLLSQFQGEVKLQKLNHQEESADKIAHSVKTALREVQLAKEASVPLKEAKGLLDGL